MRSIALALAAWSLAACGEDPPIEVPPPLECPSGQVEREGVCRWLVPELPCAPHSLPVLGTAECVPVGPGPCEPPFESDGSDWGCGAIAAADCPAGATPILGSAECHPVGWSECPEGFAPDDGSCAEVVTAELCTGATRAALGSTACVPIGGCAGAFPPPTATIVVPRDYATIGDAIAAAPSGAVVAIDSGTYAEPISLVRPVSLIGRCAELVIVEAAGEPVVRARFEGSLAGVTLRGGEVGVEAGALFALEDIVIEDVAVAGVLAVAGAEVRIDRAVIRNVRSGADGGRGRGASAERGGSIALHEVHVEDVREGGVVAIGAGSRVTIDRSVITGVRPSAGGDGGFGLIAGFGGSAIAARSLVARTVVHGLLGTGAGSVLEVSDLIVRDVDAGRGNAGIRIEGGAGLTGSRVAVRGATGVALLADDPGTFVELSDVLFEQTRAESSGFAAGAFVAQEASLSLTRARIEEVPIGVAAVLGGELSLVESSLRGGTQSIGAFVQDASFEMTASAALGHELAGVTVEEAGAARIDGVVIRGLDEARGLNSAGIDLRSGSSGSIERTAIAGVDGQGILVAEASSATITASLIEGIRMGPRSGLGIGATDGSRLRLDRVRVEDVAGIGVLSEDGPLSITGSAILRSSEVATLTPTGIAAGGVTLVRGTALIGNAGVGVVLGGSRADLDRVLISGTSALSDGRFGHAVVAESSTVTVVGSSLLANASVAAFFDASRGVVDQTLIAQNAVGVHAQSGSTLIEGPAREPIELEVLFTGAVLFLDNQTRVGTGQLPIPNPFEALP